ncbi:flagellin [Oryzihumus leptocrescens]|uniref:Flagellin n=1 Tax=Oryzihumus leptocrescens TaxID=297536 RepID=A0A542Z9C9_9MICO|nr:flagellin [Oryzihumus leptocrescens]TQL56957.1 flagellin [Oryzihumus leptocrescens]
MGLQINTNVAAMNAYRNLATTQSSMSKSLERLSSGLRINRAADDAAGLAISEGLKSQVGGLTVAARNAQDGISVVQTAEGALTETTSILQRMRDLAVQAANAGSNDANSVKDIQKEGDALATELTRIAGKTTFNNVKLLDGSYSAKAFQVGYASADQISVTIDNGTANKGFSSTDLLVDGATPGSTAVDLTKQDTAPGAGDGAISLIDKAIQTVSTARAGLGAMQNRFEHVINSVNVANENLTASKSRITDTDMAQEMTSFTRSQILQQAGVSMLAQANQMPQAVLKLLG